MSRQPLTFMRICQITSMATACNFREAHSCAKGCAAVFDEPSCWSRTGTRRRSEGANAKSVNGLRIGFATTFGRGVTTTRVESVSDITVTITLKPCMLIRQPVRYPMTGCTPIKLAVACIESRCRAKFYKILSETTQPWSDGGECSRTIWAEFRITNLSAFHPECDRYSIAVNAFGRLLGVPYISNSWNVSSAFWHSSNLRRSDELNDTSTISVTTKLSLDFRLFWVPRMSWSRHVFCVVMTV